MSTSTESLSKKRCKARMKKKRKEDEEEQHIITYNMPNEMVIEILVRVPCQDLLQKLKLVSKKWYSIIYNGSFAYSHLEHNMKKSSSFSQLKALVISTADGKSVTVSSLEWPNTFSDKPFENLKIDNRKDLFTVEYTSGTRIDQMAFDKANCVNGFVCFWSTYHVHFHICNPMTMEYVTAPPNPYWSSNINEYTKVGLGFSPVSYEYKLVIFQIGLSEKVRGSISTINGNDPSWRPLQWKDDSAKPYGSSAACVNGVLYWTTRNVDHDPHTTILAAFDVAKEECYVIEVPIQNPEHNVSIEEKGGKICLMTNEMCRNASCILFKGYIAHNNDDLQSLNSWKLEFSTIIYDIYGVYDPRLSFTNEMLMVDTYDTMGFFDGTTGQILDEFQTYASILIPYVPSLIPLHHRPTREKFYLQALPGL